MDYIWDIIIIILILGLYGRIYWMRREMDAIRLGIDVSHDVIFNLVDDLEDTDTNMAEVNDWDAS